MTSATTVRHITAPNKVFGIGIVPPAETCCVPTGAKIVELKYCEFCGISFTRFKRSADRLCRGCHSRPSLELCAETLLQDQEKYKEHLPALNTIHASAHTIKFDHSMIGKTTASHSLSQLVARKHINHRESRERNNQIRAILTSAFRERNRLNAEDLCDLYPGAYALKDTMTRIRVCLRMRITLVDYVRREGIKGKGFGVYVLSGVSPETQK